MYIGAECLAVASAIGSVTVTCPGRLSAEPAIVHIRERGNLPLLVGDQVLAELTQNDLVESWETACTLSVVELAQMCKIAGERLVRAMEERIEFADLPELVVDATVLFLLAVKGYGIRSPEDIPACSVSYDVARGQEVVVLPA